MRRLVGDVLAINRPMLGLAHKLGFAIEPVPGSPELRRITKTVSARTSRAVDESKYA